MKNFYEWNKKKILTQNESSRLYTVREVWWCRLGVNIGTEQDGKGEWFTRPCVILRGFGPDACLIAPLTTSQKEHVLRIDVGLVEGKPAKANLSQIKVMDTRRLRLKIGFIKKQKFFELKKAFKDLL